MIENIENWLADYVDRNIIIGGDFNVCLDPSIDKDGGTLIKKSRYAERLQSLQNELNLGDIWRIFNPDTRRYSWRSYTRNGFVQTRLDFWLISVHMMYDVHKTDIKPSIKSDHSLINITFNISGTQKRGRGFWKFNTSLLKDSDYISRINECLKQCSTKYKDISDKNLVWDTVKCEIRSETISYSTYKAKHNRQLESDLAQRLHELETNMSENHTVIQEYYDLKQQYENIQAEKERGAMIRSRAIFVENNEKCSKYFLGLEKRNYNVKHIKKLLTDNNKIILNPREILSEQQKFYQELYTAKPQQADHTLHECNLLQNIPRLDMKDRDSCESEFSIEELSESVKELPNNKSPGCDGLSIEFYKFFWKYIRHFLYDSYLYSFNCGKLSLDQRRAVLNLIPKADKDIRKLKNWRPLLLLNTDYKILAKALATRLQKVIGSVISHDQQGCLSGRFIGKNIRTILDVIELTSNKDISGLLVMLDFEKAFDSVSWEYLFEALKTFNFGENFINWIKLLYNDPLLYVTNNGFASFFPISRGIYALLFLLVAETMAIALRSNHGIKGIPVSENCTVVLTQYADDTTLFLQNEDSLRETFCVLEHFAKCSGLKINKDKTVIFSLGDTEGKVTKILSIKCTLEPVKVLGIWVCKNMEEIHDVNFKERIEKLRTVLNMWRQRDLSLKGKVVIINTLALSQIQYVSSVLYVSDNVIDCVNKIIFNFLWPKKTHVKKTVMIQTITNGGLRMPDFEAKVKASKIMWFRRLLDGGTPTKLAEALLKLPLSLCEFCQFKNDVDYLSNEIPPFYKQLLTYWFTVYCKDPKNVKEMRSERIWYNRNIRINNKPIFDESAYNNGLHYVNDLFDDDGMFLKLRTLNSNFNLNWKTLQFNAVKDSIPTSWKKSIKNSQRIVVTDDTSIEINGRMTNIDKVKSKDIYWELIEQVKERPTAVIKWELLYDLIHFEWDDIFCNPYICSRDTKLHSLQFQIIHRFFPCNATLHIWYKEHDKHCDYCNQVDTLEHYFYHCKATKQFWTELSIWWNSVTQVNINVSMFDILFGITNHNHESLMECLYYCLLLRKWFIVNCKRKMNCVMFISV